MNHRIFRAVLAFLLLSLIGGGRASRADAASLGEQIAQLIRKYEKTSNTGISIAVVKNGELVLTQGYGLAGRAKRRIVTADTVFPIVSITKSFTATALANLQDRGAVDFSRPVRQYLPGFRMKDPVAVEKATLADFMSHRSGLPRHEYLWMFTDFTPEQIVKRFGGLEPNADPKLGFRKGFQYSYLNYDLVGSVLEQRTGKSWESFLAQEILRPLGMKRTSFTIRFAGAINSTANDMARFLLINIRGGKTANGGNLVDRDALASLWRPQAVVPTENGKLSYGFGWFFDQGATSAARTI